MSSDLYNQIHATVTAFINSYDQENCTQDIESLSSTLTPDCRRYFAPETMVSQVPSLALGRSNGEYEAQMSVELGHFSKWRNEIKDVTVDERAKKAVVHSAHTNTVTSNGKDYRFEFIFTLYMTDDGTKVQKIVCFVDTALAAKFLEDQTDIAKGLNEQKVAG